MKFIVILLAMKLYKPTGVYVPFNEAEGPLLRAAMQQGRPYEEATKPGVIPPGFCKGGDIFKNKHLGLIFFNLPTSDNFADSSQYVNASVWAGYYGYASIYNDHEVQSLSMTFPEGVIDEGRVLLRITNRYLQAHRANFYSGNDPTMPARALLDAGIQWVSQSAKEYYERFETNDLVPSK
jgi:hypothetical protein